MQTERRYGLRSAWGWMFGRSQSQSPTSWETSAVSAEQIIRCEIEDALGRRGICRPSFRVRVVPSGMPGESGDAGPGFTVGEYVVFLRFVDGSRDLMTAALDLEKSLARRLSPYDLKVLALYWRLGGA